MIDWAAVEIRDDHIAALRLFLRDGPQAWEQLHKQEMTTNQGAAPYMEMFYAAFTIAVRRKFGATYAIDEVVRYTAKLRIELIENGDDDFNPRIAENAIRRALGDRRLRDNDQADTFADVTGVENLVAAQSVILFDMLLAEETSNEGLAEEYVHEAADIARRWIRERQATQAEEKASAGRGDISSPHADVGAATNRDAGREPSRGASGGWESS